MIHITRVEEVYSMPDEDEDPSDEPVSIEVNGETVSFRELVDLMREWWEVSCYPATGSTLEWLRREDGYDYRTGERYVVSLHYGWHQPPRREKYWRWAMKAAGLVK
jgi:hypothetical protein